MVTAKQRAQRRIERIRGDIDSLAAELEGLDEPAPALVVCRHEGKEPQKSNGVQKFAYSKAEAAASLGVSEQMISDLIAAPAVIPSVRLTSTDGPGGRRIISAKALEALVDRLEAEQNDWELASANRRLRVRGDTPSSNAALRMLISPA